MRNAIMRLVDCESINYLKKWEDFSHVVGVTYALARKGDVHVVMKHNDDNEGYVLALPLSGSGGAPCYMGTIAYYSQELQRKAPENAGIRNPFFWSTKVERTIEQWLYDSFGVCSPNYERFLKTA